MSWKVEVIADSSGKWVSNMLRYKSKEGAEFGAADLMMRWSLVREWRVIECDDPATDDLINGRIVRL